MKKTYLYSFCARCLTLLVLALLSTNLAWGETKTITLTQANWKDKTSYNTSEQTFVQDDITFGYINAMENNANGTPQGWAKNQIIQTKSGGFIYNTDEIKNITNVTISIVANTNSFTLNYGSSKDCESSIASSELTSSTKNVTYTKYENKTTTVGQTTTANVYSFDLSNQKPSYFKFACGSKSIYIYDIVITYEEDETPTIEADVESIEFEQKELDGTTTDSKTISATGKNLTAAISASMKSGSDAVFSVTPVGTPTATAAEFTVSYSTTEAGEYSGTVVLTSGETSLEIPVSASVVAHIPVLKSIAVSGTPTKMEYTVGDAFETAGLVVTGTYDVGEPQVITEGIEWAVDPETFTTAGTVSVDVIASVGTVMSEIYTVGNITVNKVPVWVKVASEPTDWSGEYLLVYENEGTAYVWTGVDAANCNKSATINDNQIAKPEGAVSLIVEAVTGGYAIKVNGGDNDSKYIGNTKQSGNAADNGFTTSETQSTEAGYLASLSIQDGAAKIAVNKNGETSLRFNNNSDQKRFRFYKSGQQAVQLYRKSIEATMTTNGCATFSSDCALDLSKLPEGLTAYKATTAGNGKVHMVAVEEAVAASTGLFLKGTENATYTIPVAASGNALEGNLLKATTGGELEADNYVYVIANNAFQPLGQATVVSKGKAYIPKDAITTSGKLEISFGEPTGIKSLTPALSEGKGVYNLNGMKVNEAYKGIVIMNGKKYINK